MIVSRKRLPKVLLTLVAAFVLYRYVDWSGLAAAVGNVRTSDYLLSAIVFLGSFGLIAIRLKVLLSATRVEQRSVGQLLNIHMISTYYGFVLPSDLGTAFARWYQLTRGGGGVLIALVTLFERFLMISATAAFALVALLASNDSGFFGVKQLVLWVNIVALIGGLSAMSLMLSRRLYAVVGRIIKLLEARFQGKRTTRLLSSYWLLSEFHELNSSVALACLVQLLFHAALLFRFSLLFAAVGITLPIDDIAWVSMTVVLLTAVPVTIAGLGVREGGFAVLLSFFSISPELGVLLGLLAFSHLVLAAVWGGLTALFWKRQLRTLAEPSE